VIDRIPIARPELGEPEWRAVRDVIDSGWISQGPKVAEFERAVARVTGAVEGVAVSSCTTALHLALVVSGIGHGSEVIVPSMSFIATANAVVHAGATPVFAEVDPVSYNLDPGDVIKRVTPRTKAVLLVHQLGLPADINRFRDLAAAHDLTLIEDAACAIGSTFDGKPIGSHGNLVCFSFHPRKLITTGDGGMIMTSSADDAALLRRLRQHGMSLSDAARHSSDKVLQEQYLEVGYNYRLTDIQAAVGLAQLDRLPAMLESRRTRAAWYDEMLAEYSWIDTPPVFPDRTWNVQTYTVRLAGFDASRRDRVMGEMLDEGVATRRGVMTAHREPAYRHRPVSLPISEMASDGSLAIPLFSDMTQDQAARVVAALVKASKAA
jgi:dTDP-4-amino-4,6-dideoxygalactose transaminase